MTHMLRTISRAVKSTGNKGQREERENNNKKASDKQNNASISSASHHKLFFVLFGPNSPGRALFGSFMRYFLWKVDL